MGYKKIIEMPEIAAKKLKIVQLPPKTTSSLQPADVYFIGQFKNLFVEYVIKWMNNYFILYFENAVLSIFEALRFENLLNYAWFRTA